MRSALTTRMAGRMLEQILQIESAGESGKGVEDFFETLFAQLSSGGHARLIAWLALSRGPQSRSDVVAGTAQRFDNLVTLLTARLKERGRAEDADRSARYLVLLVVSAAIGLGVARDSLLPQLALSDSDEAGFARWLARILDERVSG